MGKKVVILSRNSPRQLPTHPKPLLPLSPNPFSVNGHTCSESYIIVEVLLSHCKMQFLKLSTQHCSKEICQMLNVNFFRYQPILLAWGSIILLRHYHTSTQGTKVVVKAIKRCGEFSSACHLMRQDMS